MPPEDVLRARNRFVAWLNWYIAMRPEVAPTQAALARKLVIGKPALKRLMDPGSTVVPELRTLLAAERLTGFPINVLLHQDPPPIPPASR